MVLHLVRSSHERDDCVSLVFVNVALLVDDYVGHSRKIIIEKRDKLCRCQKLAERREFLDVGEDCRHFDFLAAELECLRVFAELLDDSRSKALAECILQKSSLATFRDVIFRDCRYERDYERQGRGDDRKYDSLEECRVREADVSAGEDYEDCDFYRKNLRLLWECRCDENSENDRDYDDECRCVIRYVSQVVFLQDSVDHCDVHADSRIVRSDWRCADIEKSRREQCEENVRVLEHSAFDIFFCDDVLFD